MDWPPPAGVGDAPALAVRQPAATSPRTSAVGKDGDDEEKSLVFSLTAEVMGWRVPAEEGGLTRDVERPSAHRAGAAVLR
jgi:hypothetical protein